MDFTMDAGFWIMLVSGVLTASMIQAVFAPKHTVLAYFGDELEGPSADIVIRNWGALITLVGLALIYGAFTPDWRMPILIFAGVSKLIFIGLVLTYARRPLARQAGIAVALDCIAVVLFVYLLL